MLTTNQLTTNLSLPVLSRGGLAVLETTLVVTPEDVLTEAFLLRSQWQGGKSKYSKGLVLKRSEKIV
jgi:hypothetical protein